VTYRLGVDIGGTFTDIVPLDDSGRICTKNLLSLPSGHAATIGTDVRKRRAVRQGVTHPTKRQYRAGSRVGSVIIFELRKAAR
jgi:N-methylhydantoinase A/oxoprolinase/acetone carboxylase beta subunit